MGGTLRDVRGQGLELSEGTVFHEEEAAGAKALWQEEKQ